MWSPRSSTPPLNCHLIERKAFVRSACNGDNVVASEVLEMLAADHALDSDATGDCFLKPFDFPRGGALEPFSLSPPPFQPGQVIRGRFRSVVRQVGEGGMGHVFEAWDEELGIRVALKAIRAEISNDAESLARFRREVRVGLQANHANICRIFQIDHDIQYSDDKKAAPTQITSLPWSSSTVKPSVPVSLAPAHLLRAKRFSPLRAR